MRNRFVRLLLTTLALYLGMVIMLAWLERPIIYPAPPPSDGDWNPSWLTYEDARFASADGTRLHGWFLEHAAPRATILLCHGNGEHVAYLADELQFLRERLAVNVMAFDYRGYGQSEGRPFERGILDDADAARDWLAERTGQPADSIVFFGRSIGGAVAVHLAATGGARGLVLDRTFGSLVDVAAAQMPWIPVRLLMRNRFPAQQWIKHYHGPLLQIHGEADEIVPLATARRLFAAAPSQDKKLIVSPRLGHNSPWPKEYYDELETFIASLAQPSPPEPSADR